MVDMTCCSDVHKQFDKFADGKVQVGELPKWMHVSGKVAWNVFQGPYSELGSNGFSAFWKRNGKAKLEMDGPPEMFTCAVLNAMKKTRKPKC